MSLKYEQSPQKYQQNIAERRLSVYDRIEIGDPDLWIPTPDLEKLLNEGLKGLSLTGLPLRTRSKIVKEEVCRVLGYPVPRSFKRTQPRFPGQVFDIYIQKSNNLQIWNEEISPTRRYVIIRISPDDIIERVKVVTGDLLAELDTTGTLTQKYQARLTTKDKPTELIVSEDTDNLKFVLQKNRYQSKSQNLPTDYPTSENLLPISIIFERLESLVGRQFADAGYDQERNRGAQLHQQICTALGYEDFRDDGRFPDIRNQLLEIKLQTSPTVDLGLVRPDSQEPLDIPKIEGRYIRHCDVRYALFYANTDGKQVTLTHFYLTTGEAFFTRFPQFQGKTLNKKLQIPLPSDFFD
jgi:hypothetical protein